jgi:hypothetical protein
VPGARKDSVIDLGYFFQLYMEKHMYFAEYPSNHCLSHICF